MSQLFGETVKRMRNEKGLSQRELAEQLYVTRPTVARWENGTRLPDVAMISRISQVLNVDAHMLLNAAAQSEDTPNVIMVDDRKLILSGGIAVLGEVLPNANVVGFSSPAEALEHARAHRISLAFLDIELGKTSGLELCHELLQINHHTNVIYLTAHVEYAFDAWSTGASGFMLKPITAESVREQLKNLRYPISLGGVDR